MSDRLAQVRQGQHLRFLDGLRGFAVLYVLLYHFLPKTLSLQNDFLPYKLWDCFWLMGWSGVDLFFVLSGFLITGVLYHTKGRADYFKSFYLRRFFRIFPAYYVLIFLSVIYFYPEKLSVYYWLYLSNFDVELKIPFNPFLCVAWSLSIEEQYYLFYPTLVYFLNERRWMGALCSLIVLSIALRALGHYFEFLEPRQMYHNTFAHFDGIALGGLLRLSLYRYENFKTLISAYVRLTPWLLGIASVLGFYCGLQILDNARALDGKVPLGHVSFYPPMYLFGYLLNALVFGGLILHCVFRDGIAFKVFTNPVLCNLGKYSYAMYLFQFPASYSVGYLIDSFGLPQNPFLAGLLSFATVYFFARLSWALVESPSGKLRDKLSA